MHYYTTLPCMTRQAAAVLCLAEKSMAECHAQNQPRASNSGPLRPILAESVPFRSSAPVQAGCLQVVPRASNSSRVRAAQAGCVQFRPRARRSRPGLGSGWWDLWLPRVLARRAWRDSRPRTWRGTGVALAPSIRNDFRVLSSGPQLIFHKSLACLFEHRSFYGQQWRPCVAT